MIIRTRMKGVYYPVPRQQTTAPISGNRRVRFVRGSILINSKAGRIDELVAG
jgi:hypothetical protein